VRSGEQFERVQCDAGTGPEAARLGMAGGCSRAHDRRPTPGDQWSVSHPDRDRWHLSPCQRSTPSAGL